MAAIDHATAVKWVEDYEDSSIDERLESEKARDYNDNLQWTDAELATLAARNQPAVTRNRIKPKVDHQRGVEQQTRTDPQGFPQNPDDVEAAQAATHAIRYVMTKNNFDTERSALFDNMLVEGKGGMELVVVAKDNGEPSLELSHVPWDRMFHDPHSRRPDFEDTKYKGFDTWMDLEDAITDWPDNEQLLTDSVGSPTTTSETSEDVPRDRWSDPTRKRVRVATMWYFSGGDWYYTVFTGVGFLTEPIISPYVITSGDREGETEAGFELQSAYVTREAVRYGIVRNLISIQDSINHRSSKMDHFLSQRQTYGNERSGICTPDAKAELAKADGHVEVPGAAKFGEDWGIIPTTDMANGQFTLLQEDKAEMDATGAAAALSGKGGASSGRELIARQQGGKLEFGPIHDNLHHLQHRVYGWTWNRIQQFWTEERMIRVTDDPKKAKFVELNKPITVRDRLEEEGVEITQSMELDPRIDMVIGKKNNMAQLGLDITVGDAPDTTTLVGEQFEGIVKLASSGLVQFAEEDIIEASDLPNKDKILDRIEDQKEANAEQSQQQQELIQQQVQLEVQKAMADIENTKADTEKKESETIENISQARENIASTADETLQAIGL